MYIYTGIYRQRLRKYKLQHSWLYRVAVHVYQVAILAFPATSTTTDRYQCCAGFYFCRLVSQRQIYSSSVVVSDESFCLICSLLSIPARYWWMTHVAPVSFASAASMDADAHIPCCHGAALKTSLVRRR